MKNHTSIILWSSIILLTETLYCQVNNSAYADPLHPRNYTKVIELEYGIGNNEYKIIYESTDSNIVEVVNAEVDYRSKIIIQFNKKVIKNLSEKYDGEITITGHVGTRPLEIPGYSVIGEEKRTVSAFIRSGSKVLASIDKVLQEYDYLLGYSTVLDYPIPNEEQIKEYLELLGTEKYQTSIKPKSDDLHIQTLKLDDEIIKLDDEIWELSFSKNSVDKKKKDSIEAKINIISDEIDKIFNEIYTYYDELSETARYIYEMDRLRKNILISYSSMKFDLKYISDSSNKNILEQICRLAEPEQHPDIINKIIYTLVDSLYSKLEKDSLQGIDLRGKSPHQVIKKFDDLTNIFNSIYDKLDRFYSFNSVDDFMLRERLMSEIKSTEILLEKENVRVGDNILIFVQAKTRKNDLPRTLTISLYVKEFGLVNKISDSFFLVKPLHPSEPDSSKVGESFIDTEQFTPSAGVSYFWTYYNRDADSWYSDFFRFLNPGFGLNVSFPTYQPKIVRYDTTVVNGKRQLIIEETENSFNVAFGLVVSLFDNALQFTYGLNLTAGNTWAERSYFGIGFSFINLGRRITGTSD